MSPSLRSTAVESGGGSTTDGARPGMFRSATRRDVFSSGGGTGAAASHGSVSCEAERVTPATGGSGAGVETTRLGSLTDVRNQLGSGRVDDGLAGVVGVVRQ